MAAEPPPPANPHAANPDKYDEETKNKLADTNMENYGSKEHRDMRKHAAEMEAAWDGVREELNDEEGVRVWRINKFKVENWGLKMKKQDLEGEFGNFFNGDAFICLNAYKEADDKPMKFNVHFWLGAESSQDEQGVAAYKTVELDDLLGDLPVQHREVEGCESKAFLDLFPEMQINPGGVDSGFRKVKPEEYKPCLFHVHRKKKKTRVRPVKLHHEELNSTDCFILDNGLDLYQFHGDSASGWEKRSCEKKTVNIRDKQRNGKPKKHPVITFADKEEDNEVVANFWKLLGGKPESIPETAGFKKRAQEKEKRLANHVNKAIHVSNETGKMEFAIKATGSIPKSVLEDEDMHDDVVIFDFGRAVYVWLGHKCNKKEKREAMNYAIEFLKKEGRDMEVSVTREFHGKESLSFWSCFDTEHVAADVV